MNIPKDPVMLLSFLNLKLRDQYEDLDALCEDLSLNRQDLEQTLGELDYHYEETQRQFR